LIWDALGSRHRGFDRREEKGDVRRKKAKLLSFLKTGDKIGTEMPNISVVTKSTQPFYSLTDWWREITNPWRKAGDTYCSEKYPICVTNKAHWTVEILSEAPWRPLPVLIAFVRMDYNSNETPVVIAEVGVAPPQKLKFGIHEITSAHDYLLFTLAEFKQKSNTFRLLRKPEEILVGNRHAARARVLSEDETGELVEGELYTFVHKDQGFTVAYRTTRGKFDQYREEAMKIIESFTINDDAFKRR
jgi:hypothetical protein